MQMPERWKKVLKQLDAQREAAENSGLESASSAPPIDLSDRGIKDRMEASGAIDAGRELALERSLEATRSLEALPSGPAKDALVTVAHAIVARKA